ncbi:hypothetical protein C8J56DRAFT_456907 [Mycena floridula]|nr:hypothetical protein C8J56DRAFT_456907 [Mycena floridula]
MPSILHTRSTHARSTMPTTALSPTTQTTLTFLAALILTPFLFLILFRVYQSLKQWSSKQNSSNDIDPSVLPTETKPADNENNILLNRPQLKPLILQAQPDARPSLSPTAISCFHFDKSSSSQSPDPVDIAVSRRASTVVELPPQAFTPCRIPKIIEMKNRFSVNKRYPLHALRPAYAELKSTTVLPSKGFTNVHMMAPGQKKQIRTKSKLILVNGDMTRKENERPIFAV